MPRGQTRPQNSLLNRMTPTSRASPIKICIELIEQGREPFASQVAKAWMPPIGQYASGSTGWSLLTRPATHTMMAMSTPHWRRYFGQFLMMVDCLAIDYSSIKMYLYLSDL